jgi:major membrane immunogen (membrane-anchored lipoprotein)
MYKKYAVVSLLLTAAVLTSCGNKNNSSESEAKTTTAAVETTTEAETTTAAETEAETTTEKATAPPQEVGYEGMVAVEADKLKDGEYDINVDSSSSMFKITECKLTVADGKMTAKMTMSGSGYEYLFMGTGEAAEKAAESDYINADESGDAVTFTVPVEALDKEIDCAAFSKRKEMWYDRTLVFRADSLSDEAFTESRYNTAESLALKDGEYDIDIKLEGGSGKASVVSPAKLTVKDGKASAEIIWSSNKYDYMIVEDEKIMPVSTEEFSIFEIPVIGFDYKMPVKADTTAMSTPHEIDYTIFFDSSTITE